MSRIVCFLVGHEYTNDGWPFEKPRCDRCGSYAGELL